MKRRNADCKLRRPIKRNKITEGMYGSNTILYIKFLLLWAIVITADFMLEFRFEFLWPFWLLLRSVHDSFKYKGLAFSVLFVCIAITSDLICLFFIPVHWLFFAASTYVWVQYVWHTEKGICLPTIVLWMLFLYIEGAIRWKDSRHMPHLDLCRPFAAHCIGYPVVTLGFGFKSYVGFRMRQRKQREVAKENEFYMQLLQQALPQEEPAEDAIALTETISVAATNGGVKSAPKALSIAVTQSNGHAVGASNGSVSRGYHGKRNSTESSKCDLNNHSSSKSSIHHTSYHQQLCGNSSSAPSTHNSTGSAVAKDVTRSSSDSLSGGSSRERDTKTERVSQNCVEAQSDGSPSSTKSSQSNRVQQNGGINYTCNSEHQEADVATERGKRRRTKKESARDNQVNGESGQTNHNQTSQTMPQVCESCLRLEAEVKKMRSDAGHMRQVEHDLRQKVDSSATIKSCLQAKQKENDELEKKIQDLNCSRHVDRQNLQNAEKRLGEERRQRLSLESQLINERKIRVKVEEKAAKLAECGESCKMKKRHLESEAGRLRRELSAADEQRKSFEQQNRRYEDELRKLEVEMRRSDTQQGTEMLMSALAAMQDKNSTLEKNLSAETRFKLDLFSALGEARREVDIKDALIRNMEKEMLELKGKIAQLLAVMPAMPTAESFSLTPNSSAGSSMLRLNDTPPLIMAQQSPSQGHVGLGAPSIICQLTASQTNCVQQPNMGGNSSTLDPNATAYTPKNSLVGGTEA